MTTGIEITLTQRGFEVTVAGRTIAFGHVDEALGFAQQRLQRALELRGLSQRCE